MRQNPGPAPRPAGAGVAAGAAALVLCLILAACGSSGTSGAAGTSGGTASAGTPAGAAVPATIPAGFLSHQGRWFTDSAGRVVLLHGVNMVEKTPPYYPRAKGFGPADAAWLSSQGLDLVRLGVLPTGLMPSPGHITSGYLAHLAATVATLGRHHVEVLLDLHQDGFGPAVGSDGFPAWMTITNGAPNNHAGFPTYYLTDQATQQAFQSLWDNAKGPDGVGLQTDVARMFGALARTFAATPNVIGYDAFNEPWPGTTWQPCLSNPQGCPDLVTSELDPLYAKVDRAIRRYDHRHVLLVEPFVLFNYGTATTTVSLPAGDPASGMSFHQYATGPSGAASVLSNAVAWSARTGGALLDTEWGAIQTGPAITAQADQFDAHLVPWTFWSFDGQMVRHLADPPTPANLVASTVDAVVRPYLQLVAGTPTSVTYGAATAGHPFHASWSTTEPGGRTPPAGTATAIQVPKLDYPGGYRAQVTGGRVTSSPCAPVLTVVAQPGAARVSVQLTGATGGTGVTGRAGC